MTERCRRLLNLTLSPGSTEDPDEEPTHVSLTCARELGHGGKCWFPKLQETASVAVTQGANLRLVART